MPIYINNKIIDVISYSLTQFINSYSQAHQAELVQKELDTLESIKQVILARIIIQENGDIYWQTAIDQELLENS